MVEQVSLLLQLNAKILRFLFPHHSIRCEEYKKVRVCIKYDS